MLSLKPHLRVSLDQHVHLIPLPRDRATVRQALLFQSHSDHANHDNQNDCRSEPKIHGVFYRHGHWPVPLREFGSVIEQAHARFHAETYHTRRLAEGLLGIDHPNLARIVRQTQFLARTQVVRVW